MDDATSLVAELQKQLADLDSKVVAYRQELLAEFNKHMEHVLQGAPERVSVEVSRVIAESLAKYQSPQQPSTPSSPVSPVATQDRNAWIGRKSPPPLLPHTSAPKDVVARDPHEREKEFRGLFTPVYLPLLDDRTDHSPPMSPPPPTSPPPTSSPLPNISEGESGSGTSSSKEGERPVISTLGAAFPGRPSPLRTQTDATVSSVDSSGSDTKGRRSALRRSSSSNKGSPRRVRFDFQGQEVLPTASPQASALALAEAVEAEAAGHADTSAILDDDSTAYAGTSLLDVEGEEDLLPRPKKVSSTQALRALSKSPLEAGAWTVVNPDPEEQKTRATPEAETRSPAVPIPVPERPSAAVSSLERHLTARPIEAEQTGPLAPSASAAAKKDIDEEDASDEEFLSMRHSANKKSPSPSTRSPARSPSRSPITSSLAETSKPASVLASQLNDMASSSPAGPVDTPTSQPDLSSAVPDDSTSPRMGRNKAAAPSGALAQPSDDQTEDMFGFDDEDLSIPSKDSTQQTTKYLPEDDDDDGSNTLLPGPRREEARTQAPAASSVSRLIPAPLSSTPQSTRPVMESIGSYKGSSLQAKIIKDQKILDEVAAMGDFSSFVGSVDGRSGFDPADASTFRASLSKGFAGTPRSFSERMAIEEARKRGDIGDSQH